MSLKFIPKRFKVKKPPRDADRAAGVVFCLVSARPDQLGGYDTQLA
ncbi:hypothetical protein [Aliiroseovarius marinus]